MSENSIMTQTQLDIIEMLNKHPQTTRGPFEWEEWVTSKPIIVSETSCDGNNLDNQESCEALTDQLDPLYGVGSIAALDASPEVWRWSWWTSFRVKIHRHSNTSNP